MSLPHDETMHDIALHNGAALLRETARARSPLKVAVWIISPARLYRESLCETLARRQEVSVSGEAAPSQYSLAKVMHDTSATVIIDMATLECLDFVCSLREAAPAVKIIALGISEVNDQVLDYVEAGITGYVDRDSSVDNLIRALRSSSTEPSCPPQLTKFLFSKIAAISKKCGPTYSKQVLTPREHDVAHLLAKGFSNKKIALSLNVSTSTVKNHVHNLLGKLQVRTRWEAAAQLKYLD